jgi:hypothetical protein
MKLLTINSASPKSQLFLSLPNNQKKLQNSPQLFPIPNYTTVLKFSLITLETPKNRNKVISNKFPTTTRNKTIKIFRSKTFMFSNFHCYIFRDLVSFSSQPQNRGEMEKTKIDKKSFSCLSLTYSNRFVQINLILITIHLRVSR